MGKNTESTRIPACCSVKHEYDTPWDPEKPLLHTCNPGSMQYVSHGLAPQIVDDGEEVVFSYDVIFKVSYATTTTSASTEPSKIFCRLLDFCLLVSRPS